MAMQADMANRSGPSVPERFTPLPATYRLFKHLRLHGDSYKSKGGTQPR